MLETERVSLGLIFLRCPLHLYLPLVQEKKSMGGWLKTLLYVTGNAVVTA